MWQRMQKANGRFDRQPCERGWNIRWLCTDIWPTVYQVLILQGHDPFTIWSLPKPQAIALMPHDTPLGLTIRAFYRAAQSYYPSEETIEEGLMVIETGVSFLQTVKAWWEESFVLY